jgi:hypothetical protein
MASTTSHPVMTSRLFWLSLWWCNRALANIIDHHQDGTKRKAQSPELPSTVSCKLAAHNAAFDTTGNSVGPESHRPMAGPATAPFTRVLIPRRECQRNGPSAGGGCSEAVLRGARSEAGG